MRTVTYKSVLEGALRMRSLDPATALDLDKLETGEFLAQALADCHEFWRWPELVETEGRRYRDTWIGQAYAAGSEVWYENFSDTAGNGYYRAQNDAEPGDVPGHDETEGPHEATWLPLAQFHRYVAYAQEGETEIEAVLEAWDADPRATTGARKVAFRLEKEGVRVASDAPDQLWIEFRTPAPDFGWSALWTAASFAAGAIVYHAASGEVYEANVAAAGTDVPGASDKWDLRPVPYIFRHAAKLKAFAMWSETKGASDVALTFDNNDPAKPGKFQTALEEQVWQYTKLQGQTGRPQHGR